MALSTEARRDTVDDEQHVSASAAIHETAVLTASMKAAPPSTPTSVRQCSTRQHRTADTFLYGSNIKFMEPFSIVIPADSPVSDSLLISIGPNMDAVLNRFNLGDDILPWLHLLVSMVRSSRWEAVLRSALWSLTYEQASNLSNALLSDLKGTPGPPTTTVFSLYLCRSLTCSN